MPIRILKAIRLAFALLTIVPQGLRKGETTDADLAASRHAFPVVGVAIGFLLAGLSELFRRLDSAPSISAFVLLLVSVAVSGGVHLDGLADTSDGLFLWGDARRRLEIMRDPHVGAFGVAAIVLVLLGQYAALTSLAGRSRSLALFGAAVISRSVVLISAGLAPYARPEGTGRIVIDAATPGDSVRASILVAVVGLALFGPIGLLASGAVLLLAGLVTSLALRKIEGVTGDILGALVELGQLVFLVALGLSNR